MTDDELLQLLRPHAQRLFDAGVAFAKKGAPPKPVAPPPYAAGDAKNLAQYFAADADGYPGELHRHFGCGPKEFAGHSGLVRKQITDSLGRKSWRWVRPEEAKKADAPASPPASPPPTAKPAASPAASKLVNPRDVIAKHGGNSTAASEQIATDIQKHLATGGKVSLWMDGKEIPVAKVEGNKVLDAKGQQWGMRALAMGTPGTKTGVEFHPSTQPAEPPPAPKPSPPPVSPPPLPATDTRALVERNKQWAVKAADTHADAVAKHFGIDRSSARWMLHNTIQRAMEQAAKTGSATLTIPGRDGKMLKVTVRRKKKLAEAADDWEIEVEPVAAGQQFAAPGAPPRPGLVWKEETHRWIHPETGEEHEHGSPSEPTTEPVRDDTAAVDAAVHQAVEQIATLPEVQADPGAWAKAKDLALTAATKVYMKLVAATPAIHKLMNLAGAVFDTPQDLQKAGYNPTLSSGVDRAAPVQDPVRAQLGISTHLATTIASHVLAKGLTWLKGRAKQTHAADTWAWLDEAATWLAELFTETNAAFGLPPVDVAAVRAAVGTLAGAQMSQDAQGNEHDAKDGKFAPKGGGGSGAGDSGEKRANKSAYHEPHQHTRDDFGKALKSRLGDLDDAPWAEEMIAREHRKHIEDAVAAGKSVPENVLADYPDLAKAAAAKPDDERAASLRVLHDRLDNTFRQLEDRHKKPIPDDVKADLKKQLGKLHVPYRDSSDLVGHAIGALAAAGHIPPQSDASYRETIVRPTPANRLPALLKGYASGKPATHSADADLPMAEEIPEAMAQDAEGNEHDAVGKFAPKGGGGDATGDPSGGKKAKPGKKEKPKTAAKAIQDVFDDDQVKNILASTEHGSVRHSIAADLLDETVPGLEGRAVSKVLRALDSKSGEFTMPRQATHQDHLAPHLRSKSHDRHKITEITNDKGETTGYRIESPGATPTAPKKVTHHDTLADAAKFIHDRMAIDARKDAEVEEKWKQKEATHARDKIIWEVEDMGLPAALRDGFVDRIAASKAPEEHKAIVEEARKAAGHKSEPVPRPENEGGQTSPKA